MTHKCFRCNSELKDVTPSEVTDIKFLSCENCRCQFSENSAGRLYDRWLMPITLPLYNVIFEKEPLDCVENIVKEMATRENKFVDALIEALSDELVNPKQRVTDIHDFSYPDEVKLRKFLGLVKDGLEDGRQIV